MKSYRLDVVSLVPQVFASLEEFGVIGRALKAKIAELHIHNPRDFTTDKYHKVDDMPYGGGAGMLLKPEPIFKAVESIPLQKHPRVLLMTPQGKPLSQRDLFRWSVNHDQLILICGHYEGFDERVRSLADEEISIGDYVLTGGELPAMSVITGVVRLLPGTVGKSLSLVEESYADDLLDHPHYTRPAEFRGMTVPNILRSGDHGAVSKWRQKQREIRTKQRRPDLYEAWLTKQSLLKLKMESSEINPRQFRIGNEYEIYPDW